MSRSRIERKNDFDEFFTKAKLIFNSFRDNDKNAEKFERIYMLAVCPGSRAGGQNDRVVEVFWGSRPFESKITGNSWKALTEYGATLLFSRDDSGYVLISLYPANTENRKPIESSITLYTHVDPKKLKNKVFLKRCWNSFMAYMEYTSLDGNPSVTQKLKISYLHTFKHLIIDNQWRPIKFIELIKDLLKFALTVGLSGFIIYILTIHSSNQDSVSLEKQTLLTEKKIITILNNLDSIEQYQMRVTFKNRKTDSLKNISKQNKKNN